MAIPPICSGYACAALSREIVSGSGKAVHLSFREWGAKNSFMHAVAMAFPMISDDRRWNFCLCEHQTFVAFGSDVRAVIPVSRDSKASMVMAECAGVKVRSKYHKMPSKPSNFAISACIRVSAFAFTCLGA
jgi:hypothetical protein